MTQLMTAGSAESIIESLRKGVPPRRHTGSYSSGGDFVLAVRRRHLDNGISNGKIRFVNGAWGAGKTHFLRRLREEAFDANLLVSTVELSAEQAPFNKFERVLFEIVRNIASPHMYESDNVDAALPFGEVLREAFDRESERVGGAATAVEALKESLLQQTSIDIDFRRIVAHYWDTFAAVDADPFAIEQTRGSLLQWFQGEGQGTALRREFGIQKMVSKDNARLILVSLGHFVKWLGYGGLVILLDESEMTHSTMRKSSLKQAHNNLLHLINEVDESEGLFLLYAAVPEFFNDEKFGIVAYGALAARVGKPEARAPQPLDRIWNLDAAEVTVEHYQDAAAKIREIYLSAYPEFSGELLDEADLRRRVAEIVAEHPEFSAVSAWRVVIAAVVALLDRSSQGEELSAAPALHASIMERLGDG